MELKRIRSRHAPAFLAGLAFAFASFGTPAADDAKAQKEQVKRLLQQSRKLEQEKAQLVQEKTVLEGKLTEVQGEVEGSRKHAAAASGKAAALKKELETTQAEKEAIAAKLAETERQLAKLSEQQRGTEAERRRLDALAAQQKQSIASCEQHNAQLHGQGVALLEKYQAKGCFDAAFQGEPFTGLKQVQIENFIEDSREKLDEHKLEPQSRR